MPTRSSAAAAAASSRPAPPGISPPRPPFDGFASTSSSAARKSTRSASSFSTAPSQMDSSFWSPASSASSVFQLAQPPSHRPPHGAVKDEPDQLAGHFPSLRLASASEAESSTADGDDDDRQALRAYKAASSASSSKTRGSKGSSKRAKVSEEEEDDDDDEAHDSADASGGGGVTRKLSLKTRNRLKQRAHRERRALHLSTLESQVAEMSSLKADLAGAQAALAHADAVAQGQRMTYEAMIRDLSMRDREREGLLLAFQSEIFRLRALVGHQGDAAAAAKAPGGDAGGEPSNGADLGAAAGVDGAALEAAAVSGQEPPKAPDAGVNQFAPQPFPFPGMGQQQPFYFFAPPPPPPQGHAQQHHFGGAPVWHGPPAFGPPPLANNGANGARGPAFHPGPPPPLMHQHSHTHLHLTPNGPPPAPAGAAADGMPYNLFPPHLRPAATGLSPKAPSPDSAGLIEGAPSPAAPGSTQHASPALSQPGFASSDEQQQARQSGSSPAAGGQVVVNSPPIPSSSKLLSTLPQLQTQFQPPSLPLLQQQQQPATTASGSGGSEQDKEALDGLVPMATSPSILTPTAAAPHHGLFPQAGGPMPSPYSAFPYGGYPLTAGGSGHNWSFTATTPTNGMGSALWGGLGVPSAQTWPWMGGGVSPVASSPAWAAWGNPPSGRPSSSGNGDGNAA